MLWWCAIGARPGSRTKLSWQNHRIFGPFATTPSSLVRPGPWEHVLMFGGLAYVGHRISSATEFLEERVMMEAKRRINANQVRCS